MSAITDIRCALTRKAFDAFCTKYHIPEEVHPVLPNQNDTIHERPAGKIWLYTRFFYYAKFRLPLSSFLVDVLRYFRINISQLSVIGAAKVSHFEILCRVHDIVPTVWLFHCFYVNSKKNGWIYFSKCSDNAPVCYTKPLDSLKNWNNHFFWVDDFAYPARFLWHSTKNVTRDPALAAADFSAQDYATLVAHPSLFWKFSEEFMCLVGLSCHYTLDRETYPLFLDKDEEDMDLFAFIQTPDPTKVKVVEREQKEDKPQFLETTVGHNVPLLPVAPDRGASELEASVGKLFDEDGSGNQMKQGDSVGGGGGVIIQPTVETTDVVIEVVAYVQQKRPRKRKTMAVDAGGKSRSSLQRLLAGAVLNVDVRGEVIPTLPFVTSSVSATPERETGDHTDSVTRHNLRTVGAPQRFVISSDSSHHSGANVAEAEVDSIAKSSVPVMIAVTTTTPMADPAVFVKEKTSKPSLFATVSSSAGGADPNAGIFSDLTESDFLVSGVCTVINPDTDLQKVYVPQWSMTNGSRLDDGRVCHEMVDEFAPPKFFASVRGMKHDQLFTKFNVGAAGQMSLSAEVRMHADYNIKEKRRLKSVVDEKNELLKARDEEIVNLKAQMLLKEAEDAEAIRLRAEASTFEAVEKSLRDEMNVLKKRNTILKKERNALDVKATSLEASAMDEDRELVHELEDDRMREVNDKFDKLYAGFIEMALHLEERFYPHLLTTISGRRWLLTHGMELAISKSLNFTEYLSALRTTIGKAIEKGMQNGLSAGITHGTEGRALTNVAAYNPSAEADYISALQHLQSVNFSLLAELRSNKDASIDTLMNILRLDDTLAERLGLIDSHVRKIKENIANYRSALRDVFVTLAEPLSFTAVTGTEGTSDVVPATADITIALSTTFASASTVTPISVYDYEVTSTDDQTTANENVADGNANPFPNVDDVELNAP
ncbi:hypothetical protein Tco_0937134 [Tanacetum coccineum]|uniref:Transposase (putative) gypsy type domain-containing protein n=1 Tax=Tanacetum coccineum TaxID=301880 RepID=A0ABQ5DKE7_9ASTR